MTYNYNMNKNVFIAKVSDNQDPDNLHRVKVTFTNENEVVTDWIPVLSYNAGNDNGIYSLPDIDEQVLIISLNELNTQYCVIGSIWSNDVKPPETGENSDADLNQDGKNSLHFIKTKSGNMLIFDDTDSKEKIQFITSEGKSRIEFSTEDELINIETETDLKLTAKKKISINAEEIEITSKKQFNISADEFQTKVSKELSINADKDITLKGSGIALN